MNKRGAREELEEFNEGLKRVSAFISDTKALLTEILDNGLIYWDPTTARGHVAKAEMIRKINQHLDRMA